MLPQFITHYLSNMLSVSQTLGCSSVLSFLVLAAVAYEFGSEDETMSRRIRAEQGQFYRGVSLVVITKHMYLLS